MLSSFVPVPPGSHFPLENLPFGVFRPQGGASPRVGVALGDHVIDLSVLADAGIFADCGYLDASPGASCFHNRSLNEFMAMGKGAWLETRHTLQSVLSADNTRLQDDAALRAKAVLHKSQVSMELPAQIGDYSDFTSSLAHANNIGALFRSKDNTLLPNWLRLPVAYHGRSSSIILSGTPVTRPLGQLGMVGGESDPRFGPSAKLDYELEMGAFIGPPNELGQPIPADAASDHVFGFVLSNDWSARDIQFWEYQPLGPFLGKNFATSISPWVVTMEALKPYRCEAPLQSPEPLPYLREKDRHSFDIHLEVELQPAGAAHGTVVARSNYKKMYWTIAQQVAHHTINGCNLRPGDMLGSGTVSSGSDPDTVGSLLEATKGGKEPILVLDSKRAYLEDGDVVILRGFCEGDHEKPRIGFGECVGRVEPAPQLYA